MCSVNVYKSTKNSFLLFKINPLLEAQLFQLASHFFEFVADAAWLVGIRTERHLHSIMPRLLKHDMGRIPAANGFLFCRRY